MADTGKEIIKKLASSCRIAPQLISDQTLSKNALRAACFLIVVLALTAGYLQTKISLATAAACVLGGQR